MRNKKALLAIVATAAMANLALAAASTPAGGSDPSAVVKRGGTATQPGLPDPSGTARMSDVGDGSPPPGPAVTPSTSPITTSPDPAPPVKPSGKTKNGGPSGINHGESSASQTGDITGPRPDNDRVSERGRPSAKMPCDDEGCDGGQYRSDRSDQSPGRRSNNELVGAPTDDARRVDFYQPGGRYAGISGQAQGARDSRDNWDDYNGMANRPANGRADDTTSSRNNRR